MSTTFVHVGQAGCQIAHALWPYLARERVNSADMFHLGFPVPQPRALLVDAEPKVVEKLLAAGDGNFAFDPSCIISGQSGRGGNFALGYAGGMGALPATATPPTMRPELVEEALEGARRELERCHGSYLGTVFTHSLGGGTGSGLGTRLLEEFRDSFPSALVLTVSVLPMSHGENPMQSYNSLLALAGLQELADGVVLYENDRLLAAAESFRSTKNGADNFGGGTSLASMNAIVVRDLIPLLCQANLSAPLELGSLLSSVCPMPSHRFAQAFSAELSTPCEQRQLLDALCRGMPRIAKGSASVLGAHAVVRGLPGVDATHLLERMGGSVSWNSFCLDMQAHPQPLRSAGNNARISVLVNWKRSAQVIGSVVKRARQKYEARMFLHWYERYGFGRDVFENAFEVMEEVVSNYEAA